MRLAVITAHAGAQCIGECLLSWGGIVPVFVERGFYGILPAFQSGFEAAHDFDVLAYLHDDFLIREPDWHNRVLAEFDDPSIGLVGFVGALGHGAHDIYKSPYRLEQLARFDVFSNLEDAEAHGKRFSGSREVAVLDGLALIVRRELLEKAGGWPIGKIRFHCYDYWLCCMAHRLRYKIRMVGVACKHLGGRTSVEMNMDDGKNHGPAHEYIYNEFKDVLPWVCK